MAILKWGLAAAVLTQLAVAAVWADEPAKEAQFNFVPWPQSVTAGDKGEVALTAQSRIVATDKALAPLADVLSGEIQMITGLRLAKATDAARAGDIVLATDPALTPPAAYTVAAGPDRIVVKGGGYIGVAHGTSLLLQAIVLDKGKASVPAFAVQDKPYSEYYGTMLDIARQENSMDDIKQVVEMCRLYRIRFLQFHMSDDQGWTWPSKAYPKLGTKNSAAHGGPVPRLPTLDQWKDLVKFADDRGVTIVPEIETPGHSGAARGSLPEAFGPDVGVMNIANPNMYVAMDTIIGELADVFKSTPYIHIGCDECSVGAVANTPAGKAFMAAHKITDAGDLFAWHIATMNDLVKKRGKRTIVWQDAPLTARVPKDVIVMVWHIDGDNGATMDYLRSGRPVIQVTWTPCVYQPVKDVYNWNAWTKDMSPKLMLGAQMVLWERPGWEAVPKLRYKSPPRNERVWNPFANRPYEDFARRLEATDATLDRVLTGIVAEEKGLLQTLGAWLQEGGQGSEGSGILPKFSFDSTTTVALRSSVRGAHIRCTADGKDPAESSTPYTAPIKLADARADKIVLKARLFDMDGKPVGGVWVREYNRDKSSPAK